MRSNPVEDLNEDLSVKDALMERILFRIDQTPIREIKPILMQYLDETLHQKSQA
jgi:hypothetical protein